MVFSSYVFILAFLPVVLIVYYLLSRARSPLPQRLFLIAASLFFYGYYNVRYLLLIVMSIAVNYFAACRIRAHRADRASEELPDKAVQGRPAVGAKLPLTLGILFNIALLGYFKYYDFFIENINRIAGTSFALRHILLPLGISFFTFQQLSFLVSVYHGEEEVGQLRDYCLFVTFFPQLVAGPIVLYSEMIPQFKDERLRRFNADNFAAGIYLFTIGLFKKAVVADSLAFFADAGFGMTDIGLAAGWCISLSYTLQIFFDFSGYSDMAVGLGRMFNINIPMNFWKPYRSESISEFWRRWHITLGRALGTYVYKPLGGNRKGLPRTCINLFLTFLVSGLWHGAAWTFVLWGALHGGFVVLERIFREKLARIPKALRIAVTFLIVNALWVLFRAESFPQALEVYRGMLNISHPVGIRQLIGATDSMVQSLVNLVLIALSLLVLLAGKRTCVRAEDFTPTRRTFLWSAVFFMTAFLCLSRESIFIYFNF